MDPFQQTGKALIFLGAAVLFMGLIFYFGKGLGPLGKLPGDIRLERHGFGFYFPIVTCLILSVVLSLILLILSRFR